MKILADENIPLSVVELLRMEGHDVVTLYDLGKGGASNGEVVEIAKNSDRTILTLDLDFGRVYYFASGRMVNIIVIRTKAPTSENVAKLLVKLLESHTELKGLIIISEKKMRIIR